MASFTPYDVAAIAVVAATVGTVLFLRWPKAYTLALGLLAVFFVQFAAQASGEVGVGTNGLALVPGRTLAGDGLWTLVSYGFLHASIGHILGNLLILVTAGPALEQSTGPRWFLIIYATALLAAAGAGLAMAAGTDIVRPDVPMVGASGAIFGVLTAYAIRHPREKLPIILVFFVTWFPAMGVLIIYLLFNVAYMLASAVSEGTQYAWYGHFAGFLVGLVFAGRAGRLGAAARPRLELGKYRHLTSTTRGKEAVRQLERTKPGEEAVAEAWLDVLASESACPACSKPLQRRGFSLSCPDGHSLERRS